MAESTVVSCPNCGKKYKIGADKLGRTFKCTGCETRFAAGTAPEPTPPPVEETVQETEQETDQETDQETTFSDTQASYEQSAASQTTVDYSDGGTGKPKTSGMAIASLICGILGCIPGAQIAAVILGLVSLKKINKGLAGGKVLAIIGILLGVLGIGSWIYGGYMGYKGYVAVKAMVGEQLTTQAELGTLNSALLAFDVDNGRYPTTDEGLQALVTKPAGDLPNWKHSYLDKLPVDPWNHPFVYQSPGTGGKDFDLYSLGGPNGPRINYGVSGSRVN